MSYPHILFIRHGETEWNAQARLQGQQDIALNATGEMQARHVGSILAGMKFKPNGWEIYVSPMTRTMRTFELADEAYRAATGQPLGTPAHDVRLKEVTFGDLEGMTLADLSDQEFADRRRDPWNFQPPNGESYAQGARRAVEWLRERNKPTLVVSHGGICRGLRKEILSLTASNAAKFHTPQGAVLQWRDNNETIHDTL